MNAYRVPKLSKGSQVLPSFAKVVPKSSPSHSKSYNCRVYKVIHGYLQYHHHHWRHHHRCHHNQHDVHQLFQSNSILRVPKTRSPPHAMPSFSSWDGLPLEDFRWLQLNTKVIRRLSLYSYSLSSFAFTSFSMIISDDSSRIISAGATLLLVAFIVLHHPGLGVVTTPPRWCYVEDGDNCLLILRHVIHFSRLSHASSDWFLSSQVSDVTVFMLMMQMQMTMLVVCNFTVTVLVFVLVLPLPYHIQQ